MNPTELTITERCPLCDAPAGDSMARVAAAHDELVKASRSAVDRLGDFPRFLRGNDSSVLALIVAECLDALSVALMKVAP